MPAKGKALPQAAEDKRRKDSPRSAPTLREPAPRDRRRERERELDRARREEPDMDDLPRKPTRPRQLREPPPPSTFCARAFLVVVNAASIIFGSLLLFYGVKAYVALKAEEEIDGVHRPFAVVLAGGAVMMVFSFFGLFGACCAVSRDHGWKMACCSNRLLMAYFVAVLLLSACLFYGMLLCFLFADKAAEYVTVYWSLITEIVGNEGLEVSEVGSLVEKHSKAAGGLCIGAIFLNFFCAHLSARVMGYKYTTRRMLMILGIAGFVLGVVLLIIACVPATQEVGTKGGWLPQLAGTMGAFMALMSLVAFGGAYWESVAALGLNGCMQGLLGVVVLVLGAICLADARNSGHVLGKGTWGLIRSRFVDLCPMCGLDASPVSQTKSSDSDQTTTAVQSTPNPDDAECCQREASLVVWNNLTILGVALSTTLVSILVNAFSSLYLCRMLRRDRMLANSDEEMAGLRGGRARGRRFRRYEDDDDYL